jgi:hypothetical protein
MSPHPFDLTAPTPSRQTAPVAIRLADLIAQLQAAQREVGDDAMVLIPDEEEGFAPAGEIWITNDRQVRIDTRHQSVGPLPENPPWVSNWVYG